MTIYSAADYDDEAVTDLEEENEELRKENAKLKAAAASARPLAREQANAGEAEWQARLAGAKSQDEVMAIVDERAATLTTGPTEAEMEAAHAAHAQAMLAVTSTEEAHRLHMEFLRANPWAGE